MSFLSFRLSVCCVAGAVEILCNYRIIAKLRLGPWKGKIYYRFGGVKEA
jgi:hypothetical protein